MSGVGKAWAMAIALAVATPVFPVQADEMLADPGLEARAREISRAVRCPVCQGESIDDSNARISRDLRFISRERLGGGDTDQGGRDFSFPRYGEFVLFDPPKSGTNLILWLAGPAVLILGGGIALAAFRRRGATPEEGLTAEEQARLAEILKR